VREFPDVRVRHNVRAQSSRNGASIDLLVVHDTEGANIPGSVRDLVGLGNFFNDSPGTGHDSSSHVAADSDGLSARFVPDEAKAWHCAFYNSHSLGIELIGFAIQRTWTDAQVDECARWLAYWCRKHDIPCRMGAVSVDGRILRRGILRHSDLGNLGGGHHDPGTFPLAKCLRRARVFIKLQGTPG
jgi:hypothetical protein